MKKNVLIIGSGGREHAIAKKFAESKKVGKLYVLPGNGGTAEIAENINLSVFDFDGIYAVAKEKKIDLVFVAPDDPLAKGLVDFLTEKGVRAFGPTASAARMESSKAFSKQFMKKYGIPTADYGVYDDYYSAVKHIERLTPPIVLKADGLALGKGVIICESVAEAKSSVKKMLGGEFGEASRRVLIEEFLTGREVTVLTFVDGESVSVMPSSQDHKRAYDGDKGLNTGGMGAFAPSPFFTLEKKQEFISNIVLPTLAGLKSEGIVYKGVLYFGLMMTANGIKVIEYNSRFGDPETQAVLPLLKTDLYDICEACIDGNLSRQTIEWKSGAALTVVVSCKNYPESSDKGLSIEIGDLDGVTLYHAGTKLVDGKLVTNGGRVFALTAVGDNIEECREKVYKEIDKIHFSGARYRKDIGNL